MAIFFFLGLFFFGRFFFFQKNNYVGFLIVFFRQESWRFFLGVSWPFFLSRQLRLIPREARETAISVYPCGYHKNILGYAQSAPNALKSLCREGGEWDLLSVAMWLSRK